MVVDKTYENKTKIPSSKYFHYDNLHSIDTITDNQGDVLQRFVYKAFGEEVVLNSEGDKITQKAITNRGYTGHEHVDNTPFIHMNARVYDPIIGRFTSADSIIDGVYTTQGFNRYSYVKNNPLNYTDSSGHLTISAGGFSVSVGSNGVGVTTPIVSVGLTTDNGLSGSVGNKEIVHVSPEKLKTAAIIGVGVYTGVTFGPGLAGSMEVTGAISTGAVGGAVAGAASGFTAGVVYRQDASATMKLTLNGAKAGAISGAVAGGVTSGIKELGASSSLFSKVALRTAAGGLQAKILHQDVEQGMMMGALISGFMDTPSNSNAWYQKTFIGNVIKWGEDNKKYFDVGFNTLDSLNYNQYKYGDLDE